MNQTQCRTYNWVYRFCMRHLTLESRSARHVWQPEGNIPLVLMLSWCLDSIANLLCTSSVILVGLPCGTVRDRRTKIGIHANHVRSVTPDWALQRRGAQDCSITGHVIDRFTLVLCLVPVLFNAGNRIRFEGEVTQDRFKLIAGGWALKEASAYSLKAGVDGECEEEKQSTETHYHDHLQKVLVRDALPFEKCVGWSDESCFINDEGARRRFVTPQRESFTESSWKRRNWFAVGELSTRLYLDVRLTFDSYLLACKEAPRKEQPHVTNKLREVVVLLSY